MDKELLKRISDISIYTASNSEIPVIPKIYHKIFEEVCKLDNVDINEVDNSAIVKELLDISLIHVQELIKKTRENIAELQNITTSVEGYIKNGDLNGIKQSTSDVLTLMDKIKTMEKELYTDTLTNIYNRKWLDEKILDNDARFQKDGYLVIVDLDKFKNINDTYGHTVGDRVLKFIASKLSYFDESSVVRYGGDEFIVIFEKGMETEISINSKFYKLQSELFSKEFSYNQYKFTVGFSYGLFTFKRGDTFSDILDRVDHLMYENKKQNKIKIWNKY